MPSLALILGYHQDSPDEGKAGPDIVPMFPPLAPRDFSCKRGCCKVLDPMTQPNQKNFEEQK